MKHFSLFLLALLLSSAPAFAVCPARDAPKATVLAHNGRKAFVHPSARSTMECVVAGLEKIGYPIKYIGGYGCRAWPATSLHPRGLAMDVNQSARDITSPPIPRAPATEVARACNAVHGAIWRNPDAGHFEVRSLPRNARPSPTAQVPRAQKTAQKPAPRKARHPYPGRRYYYSDGVYYQNGHFYSAEGVRLKTEDPETLNQNSYYYPAPRFNFASFLVALFSPATYFGN